MMNLAEPNHSSTVFQSEHIPIVPRTMVDPIQVAQTVGGELILKVRTETALEPPADLQPVRLPARVMRIWIAPWQDQAGDFIAAAHLYTEVEPARWLHATAPLPDSPRLQKLEDIAPANGNHSTKTQAAK